MANNLLIIDPNEDGRGNIPLEDLSIFVELKVFTRDDDIIRFDNSSGSVSTESSKTNKSTTISFIDTNSESNGKTYLNTNYTEINSEFNNSNDDLGTLGIETIDISFNASLTPIVKIRFKDVRGRLFEMGNDSPYAFLFRMPYPIFYLTVKGYYGKPIQYALHMTEFSGSLDDSTGSFVINANFIGYTYAFLSDILMGYIKAIPYTTNGKKLISNEGDYISFVELSRTIATIQKSVTSYKSKDKKLKALTLFNEFKSKLEQIKTNILTAGEIIKISNNGESFKTIRNEDIVFTTFKSKGPDMSGYKREVLTLIDEFNKFSIEKNSSFLLNKEDFALNSDGILYRKLLISDITDATWEEYQEVFNESINTFPNTQMYREKIINFKETSDIDENEKILDSYNNFKGVLTSDEFRNKFSGAFESPLLNSVSYLDVFDARLGVKIIDELILKIDRQESEVTGEVYDEFVNKINESLENEGILFDTSIGTLFKILTNHVDIFVDAIRMVGMEVKTQVEAGNRMFNVSKDSLPENNVGEQIKAFPDYLEKGSSRNTTSNFGKNEEAYVDKWIGSNPIFKNIPEVIFIEDLYRAMLKKGGEERDFLNNIDKEDDGWYPVNPLETQAFNRGSENPWSLIDNSNTDLIEKLLIERMITFLSYSNKDLTDSEIVDMAKIEAEQAFKEIKNPSVKLSMISGEPTTENFTSKRLEILKSVKDKYGLDIKKIKDDEFFVLPIILPGGFPFTAIWQTEEGVFKYEYQGKFTSDSVLERNYVPIIQDLSDLKNTENPILSSLNNNGSVSNDKIYTSNLIGGPGNGEDFIKIINPSEYNNDGIDYTDYSDIISRKSADYNITSQIRSSNVSDMSKHNYIYSGKFKTPEFSTYRDSNNTYPLHYEFYTDVNLCNLGVRKDNTKTKYDTFSEVNGEYVLNDNITPCDTKDNQKRLKTFNKPNIGFKLSSIRKIALGNEDTNDFKYQPTLYANGLEVPLFGSEFYYSQKTDEAKALLFLHTLPFAGLSEAKAEGKIRDLFNSKISNFFNKRAGFVDVPYSWVLFMGGMIHRMQSENEIITFLDNIGDSLIPNISPENLDIKKDEYLCYNVVHDDFAPGQEFVDAGIGMLSFTQPIGRDTKIIFHKIGNIIKSLPNSVKTQFVNEFINWVSNNNGFQRLKGKLEIFPTVSSDLSRLSSWLNISNSVENGFLSPTLSDNYIVVSQTNVTFTAPFKSSLNNFYLELRGESATLSGIPTASNDLIDFMLDKRVIINGTYRIWEDIDEEITTNKYTDILINGDNVASYLNTFLSRFRTLNNNVQIDDTDEISQRVFNTTNVDDIKLSLYKNVKSFYDKWIVGIDKDTKSVITNNLYDTFKIIDRSYEDISGKFKVSPFGLLRHLNNSNNVNFYNFIATILRDNNFDFHALPTFVDYSNENEVKEIFEPTRFDEMSPTVGPQFICMYIGERSNRLEIPESNGKTKNDGMFVDKDGNLTNFATDFTSDKPKIPYFMVSYADQNQSIFKNLTLDQKEFTETHEGLQIIDDLSTQNRNNSIGQNLFDIYNNRSYSAEVEMLGCAEIQPFMYFQLNNVPMFRGAYTIINTRHHIKPNHMTTYFKGVRVRKGKTKMIDDSTLYMNLIGNINDIQNETATFDSLDVSKANKDIEDKASTVDSVAISNLGFTHPLRTEIRVTSDFGPRVINGAQNFHYGADFRAEVGTPIYAPANNGVITRVRYEVGGAAGLYIDITYGKFKFRLMHLSSVPDEFFDSVNNISSDPNAKGIEKLRVDGKIQTFLFNPEIKIFGINKIIGYTGGVGNNEFAGSSSTPHLHMTIFEGNDKKNPQRFFDAKDWKWNKGQYDIDKN